MPFAVNNLHRSSTGRGKTSYMAGQMTSEALSFFILVTFRIAKIGGQEVIGLNFNAKPMQTRLYNKQDHTCALMRLIRVYIYTIISNTQRGRFALPELSRTKYMATPKKTMDVMHAIEYV